MHLSKLQRFIFENTGSPSHHTIYGGAESIHVFPQAIYVVVIIIDSISHHKLSQPHAERSRHVLSLGGTTTANSDSYYFFDGILCIRANFFQHFQTHTIMLNFHSKNYFTSWIRDCQAVPWTDRFIFKAIKQVITTTKAERSRHVLSRICLSAEKLPLIQIHTIFLM